ncbi:spore germination protein GerPC [Gorillibacterium sp. sgz500922]|uniref:spore germination protein GerPC n=1 Tax=Gorillibacterium sp. sgz500922 TaxID=3446694 RepID=UPI003F67CAD9
MNWDGRLYQLQQQVAWQSGKILELEAAIKDLADKVGKLGAVPQTRIDRIDYRFDQLKVEKLEGALHIGISPAGSQDLIKQWQSGSKEAFDVGWTDSGSPGAPPSAESPPDDSSSDDEADTAVSGASGSAPPGGGEEVRFGMPGIPANADPYRSVDRFMAEELPRMIEQYARTFQLPIEPAYRQGMADSLRGQVGDRMNYYLAEAQKQLDSAGIPDLERIAEQVKRDVDLAIRTHMEEIRRAEEEADEPAGGQ